MPARLGLVAAVGLAGAEVATYWDDSWHTDKGRDEFAIPPHLLLYGGILLASLAIAAWAVLSWRSAGWGLRGILIALRDPAIQLAGIGGVTTLASAPLDNWWHETFGRDAVLWSPPHLTAIAGTFALVVGLSAGLRNTTGWGAQTARLFAGAGIIGALQILVLEYDSDVPQFSTIWFLPVATLALCVAVALLDDLLPGRWAPAQAALLYTVLRAGTFGLLAILGFSLTVIPPVFPLLLIMGAVVTLPMSVRLVLLGALSPVVWWPVLAAQSGVTTTVPLSQLPAAIILGVVGGLVVALIHGDLRMGPATAAAARVVLVLGIVALAVGNTSGNAWAHNPGQGEDVTEVRLTITRNAESAQLRIVIPGACTGFKPVRVEARRAGETRSGELTLTDDRADNCVATGHVIGLTPGRWFVYAELNSPDGKALEAWLPVDEGATASATRWLYEPPPPEQATGLRNTVGGALLLVIAGILIGSLRLARQVARQS
jgi:hypothetical protein